VEESPDDREESRRHREDFRDDVEESFHRVEESPDDREEPRHHREELRDDVEELRDDVEESRDDVEESRDDVKESSQGRFQLKSSRSEAGSARKRIPHHRREGRAPVEGHLASSTGLESDVERLFDDGFGAKSVVSKNGDYRE
jgi:chromosome segregation ATPase